MLRRQIDLFFEFRVSVRLNRRLNEKISDMPTVLKQSYSMLTCVASHHCRLLISRPNLLFFFPYSHFSLPFTAARFQHTVSNYARVRGKLEGRGHTSYDFDG